jgi:hypothetical protein
MECSPLALGRGARPRWLGSPSTERLDLSCRLSLYEAPVELGGGVTFTASHRGAVPCSMVHNALGEHGNWIGEPAFAGLNFRSGWIRLSFANPVYGGGGFINWARHTAPPELPQLPQPFIAALDASGQVIDLYGIADIVTPDGLNDGAFRGISHATANIHAFELRNSWVSVRDIVYSTQVTVTPEPTTLVVVATGLAVVFGAARRTRSRPPLAEPRSQDRTLMPLTKSRRCVVKSSAYQPGYPRHGHRPGAVDDRPPRHRPGWHPGSRPSTAERISRLYFRLTRTLSTTARTAAMTTSGRSNWM